jgi:tetratricopeptide (TPR) repeat protein
VELREETTMSIRRISAAVACCCPLLFLSGGPAAADEKSVAEVIALLERRDADLDKESLASAITALTEAILRNPNDAEAFRGRGVAYVALGYAGGVRVTGPVGWCDFDKGPLGGYYDRVAFDRALADFNRAIAIDPRNAKAYCGRAAVCNERKCHRKAIADCNEAIRLDPKCALAYCARGDALRMTDRLDKAIADYSETVRLDPNDAWAHLTRADAYDENGDFDKAIADCTEAIRLDPKNGDGYWSRGDAYEKKGDLDKAIADYSETVRIESDTYIYQRRAAIYTKRAEKTGAKADFARAIADYSEALQLAPKGELSDYLRAELLQQRGAVYKKMGEPDKAKADFAEAGRLERRDSEEADDPDDAVTSPPPVAPLPAAKKPPRGPGRDVFGPASIGLGPDDELRIHFESSGCFHFASAEFVFAGSSPDAFRVKYRPAAFPMNQNDWWRLQRMLTAYRMDNRAGMSTTRNVVKFSWFRKDRLLREERFDDSSSKGRVLEELEGRTYPRERSPEEKQAVFSSKTYAVADLVDGKGGKGKAEQSLVPLVGLIYELVRPDSWHPGEGGEIKVAPASEPTSLTIRQTDEGHWHVARILAFLRQVRRDAAASTQAVYYGQPRTREVMESLARKIDLDCEAQPLRTVVEQLNTRYKLPLRCDDRISEEDTVTLHVRGISLRSALGLMCDPNGLECAVEDGTLVVTTRQGASDAPDMLSAHRVDDLIRDGPGRAPPEELVQTVADMCDGVGWNGAAVELLSLAGGHFLIVDGSFAFQENVAGVLYRLRTVAQRVAAEPDAWLTIPLYNSPEEKTAREGIDKALSQRISLDCREKPPAEVIAAVAKLARVNMVLIPGCFEKDARITVVVQEEDVRTVLRKVIAGRDIFWTFSHEALVIAVPGFDERDNRSVAYITPGTDCDTLRSVLVSTLGRVDWDGFSPCGASRLSLGKTKFLAVWDTEGIHAEISRLLALLRKIERESAAGRAALCYGRDFADDSVRDPVSQTLSRKVTLDFDWQPLDAVLQDLKTSFGLETKLDEDDAAALGIAVEGRVTLHVKNVPLRLALEQILQPLDLGWYADETGVTVTSRKAGAGPLAVGFYPVTDLTGGAGGNGNPSEEMETLIETIKTETIVAGVTSQDWETEYAALPVIGLTVGKTRILAIDQTDDMHERIAALLNKMRAAKRRR